MKKSKNTIVTLCVAVALVLLAFASLYIAIEFHGSIDMENPEEVGREIARVAETEDFEVVKTAESAPYRCVLIRTPDEMQLLIFKAIRVGGRYRYFGGGAQKSGCGTYQYSEPDLTFVVVFGENAGGAVRCTLRVNGKQYDWAIAGDSVLEIYALEEPMTGAAAGELLDADGNTVCVLDATETEYERTAGGNR